ncbi:MAG TPA: M1 family metallopeptidase, partial [Acetobacteraceae bacterium]|nr:M1 family metallopeptidase [Acetobacteraceae bacterium]
TLNDAGLAISHAVLENGAAATVSMDAAHQAATLHFARAIGAGKHTLTLDYTGPIPDKPEGIYYDDYKTPSGAQKRMLVTQFEVADARRMFPGWDEPAFKARFQLSVVVPQDDTAISNMPAVASTPAGPGLKKVQFATSPRMSTYLVALVAGDLAAVRGAAGPTALAAWAPTGEESQAQYALEVESHVLPYYNQYFGVPYPLPKLDLIAIPGNFEAGAMENWGAITFIDNGMLFDPKTSDAATRERIHIYVSHEMAHQWSGDLVTMAWWDDIWLNEGFATWMEFKATDHFNPAWQEWPRQHAAREEAMAEDARPTTHPIHLPIHTISEADAAFDQISYQKGSQVIRMIEDWIGPDNFRDGMRAYMKAHAYSNTTSADLWAALGTVAGKDVAKVALSFTEQPGIPLVHVTRRCANGQGTLTLTQDRFVIHDPQAKKLTWTIPITLGAPGIKSTRVVLDGMPVTVPLATCDAAEKVNLGENGYYRTEYDAASLKPLVRTLENFGPADRANLLGDQFAMFLAGRAPLESYLDMLPMLSTETNIAVWQDTIDHLQRLDHLVRGAAVRPQFRVYARNLLRPEFERLGWDAKPGESFLDTLLRPVVIGAMGEFDDPDILAEAHKRFDQFVKDPTSLPPNLREPVLTIVGHHADQATYDTLRHMGETATSTEEKLRYFGAMAAAEDPKLIAQTVQYAASGQVPNGRVPMIIAEAGRSSDNPDEVWRQVLPNQAALRAHLTAQAQTFLLPAAAFSSTSALTARALMADPSVKSIPGAKIIAKQAVEVILANAELQQRTVPALTSWLAHHAADRTPG